MKNRNVVIHGQRTSLRLEIRMWEAVDQLCEQENLTLNAFCEMIDTARTNGSRTSGIRSLTVTYFRLAADISQADPDKERHKAPGLLRKALEICFP